MKNETAFIQQRFFRLDQTNCCSYQPDSACACAPGRCPMQDCFHKTSTSRSAAAKAAGVAGGIACRGEWCGGFFEGRARQARVTGSDAGDGAQGCDESAVWPQRRQQQHVPRAAH